MTTGYSLYPHSILSLMTIHEDDLKGEPALKCSPILSSRGACPDMIKFRTPIRDLVLLALLALSKDGDAGSGSGMTGRRLSSRTPTRDPLLRKP